MGTMLDRIQDTERRILHEASQVEDHGSYVVCRSVDRPNWYQANHIDIVKGEGRSLDEWEAVFRSHFEPGVYRHLMMHVPREEGFEELLAEARKRATLGAVDEASPMQVEHTRWMLATDTSRVPDLAPGLEVRPVESEAAFESLIEFGLAEAREAPWFTNDEDVRRFIESRREVTDRIGCVWFRLMRRGSDEILARLGMFEFGGVSRLQSVGTALAHRRLGYGGMLVGWAIRESLRRGSDGLCLAADADSAGESLYTRVGFDRAGEDFWILRYPR